MPELPEVEIVRLGLEKLTRGIKIEGGDLLLNSTLAYPSTEQLLWQGLTGKEITSWERRGKYLLASLSGEGGHLGVHLRMTGQLLWLGRDTAVAKHTRWRCYFEGGQELRLVDIRTFGKVWWVPPNFSVGEVMTGLGKLGPEPFEERFTPEYLSKKLEKSDRLIKSMLLDQGVVAGIGNIYADESLFRSGIRPNTKGRDLKLEQIERLHQSIIAVLQKAIASGGTSFSDFISVTGTNGNYGGVAWVYRRTGQPCRVCGSAIERLKLLGRSTHFCPDCQS